MKTASILTSSYSKQSRNFQIVTDSQKGCKDLAIEFQVIKTLPLFLVLPQ